MEPVITIPFLEYDESPAEQYGGSNPTLTATMKIRCAWADRHTLARELLGGVQTVNGISTYTFPYLYPYDSYGNCRLKSVSSIEPEGEPEANTDARFKKWEYALLTLNFAIDPFDYTITNPSPNNLKITNSFSGYSDISFIDADPTFGDLWLHYGVKKTVDGTDFLEQIAGESPARQIHGVKWQQEVIGKLSIHPDLIEMCGKVNQSTFYIPSTQFKPQIACPPETMMFETFETSDVFSSTGERQVRLVMYFNYKNLGAVKTPNVQPSDTVTIGGWNHVLPPGEDDPVRLWNSSAATPAIGTLYRAYKLQDFSLITDFWE